MTRLDRHVHYPSFLPPHPHPPRFAAFPFVSRSAAADTRIARANTDILAIPCVLLVAPPFLLLPPSPSHLAVSCWLAARTRTYARTRFTMGFRVFEPADRNFQRNSRAPVTERLPFRDFPRFHSPRAPALFFRHCSAAQRRKWRFVTCDRRQSARSASRMASARVELTRPRPPPPLATPRPPLIPRILDNVVIKPAFTRGFRLKKSTPPQPERANRGSRASEVKV